MEWAMALGQGTAYYDTTFPLSNQLSMRIIPHRGHWLLYSGYIRLHFKLSPMSRRKCILMPTAVMQHNC